MLINNNFKKVLFIDRDGTLVDEPVDNFQIDSIEKIQFKPGVFSSLSKIKNYGYTFIIVSNQDGLGTEQFPLSCFKKANDFIINVFFSQNIIFEHIFICSHFFNDNCNCRKPKLGLVKDWLLNNPIDKEQSYVIGDRKTDLEFAKNIGIKGLLYKDLKNSWFNIEKKICNNNRYAKVLRNTKESSIVIEVWLDKENNNNIDTGISFFNHMLEQVAVHSGVRMYIKSKGDLHIDDHHTVEDTGIALGQALLQALGNKKGISRYGFTLPMDESTSTCTLDLSGRPYLSYICNFKYQKVGDLSTDMIEHFFNSMSNSLMCTIHLSCKGNNDHHIAECLFKSFGRSLRQAIRIVSEVLPSSKGIL